MDVSKRIKKMSESPIRKLIPVSDQVKKEGVHVYHLNIGQPDIETPKAFYQAIANYKQPVLKYADSRGILPLRQAYQAYYDRAGFAFSTDEILVTNGGSEALLFALMTLCDPGDQVLVPEPFYTNYNAFALAGDIEIIPIPTNWDTGFSLPDKATIEALITPKTRAILVSNPGNPTGKVLHDEEMRLLVDLLVEHEIFLIADEVYREFVYGGSWRSFAEFDELKENLIVVDSVSKRYSACGARIGVLASKNALFIKETLKLCQGRLCVPTLEQIGAVELLARTDNTLPAMVEEYQVRRDVMTESLKKIPGVKFHCPEGAFYMIIELPVSDAEDFVRWMLGEFQDQGETLMVSPAKDFYKTPGRGLSEVRISYVLKKEDLIRSMEILQLALKAYQEK
ncbi:pyridoxal phosphate-dependent aminotransferase [Gottschalkiaceae bacterium SANA]|nr:pyridoxal phosphate-dependent aminotransferase [Gottschalkiaceae bacterium SANA]